VVKVNSGQDGGSAAGHNAGRQEVSGLRGTVGASVVAGCTELPWRAGHQEWPNVLGSRNNLMVLRKNLEQALTGSTSLYGLGRDTARSGSADTATDVASQFVHPFPDVRKP